MSIELALVLARWAHYTALTTLFGLSLFPAYNRNLNVRPVRQHGLFWLAVATTVSGLIWGLASVAEMSGTWVSAVDPSMLAMIIQSTPFGLVWSARVIGALATVLLLWPSQTTSSPWISAAAATLLASIALTGHTREETGFLGAAHIVVDAIHLLAAGAWLGALTAFISMMARRDLAEGVARSLHDFAGVGALSVALLAATGVINGALILRDPSLLLTSAYGGLLLAKVALVAIMVVLAALNRFWLSPILLRDDSILETRKMVRRLIIAEQFTGLAVLLIVAMLGTMDPRSGL